MQNFEQIQPATPEKKKPKFIPVETHYGVEKEKMPNWEVGVETSNSEDHPEHTEDAYFFDARRRIAGLFDGVGGASGGKIASHESADLIHRRLGQIKSGISSKYVEREISFAMLAAHQKIMADAERVPSLKGMATTASVGKIIEEGGVRKLVYGQIGDSRIYVLHRNGILEQATRDDSLINDQIDRTKKRNDAAKVRKLERIAEGIDNIWEAPEENADLKFFFEQRNVITSALGYAENFGLKTGTKNLDNGDIVLFTSDGIHDNLTKEEIREIADKYWKDGPQRISEALVEAANEIAAKDKKENIRAKHDDKTAMVLMEEIPEFTPEEVGMKEIN